MYGYEIDKRHNTGHITSISAHNEPSFTCWDLGVDDTTAIVFAFIKENKAFIIDYYENTGYDIKHYLDVVNEKNYK